MPKESCHPIGRRARAWGGNPERDTRDCQSRIQTLTTQAVYYRDANGHEPVDAWIDALPAKVALKVDDSIAWPTFKHGWMHGPTSLRGRPVAMLPPSVDGIREENGQLTDLTSSDKMRL